MNCNDCGGSLPGGCDCSPFGGRRSRDYAAIQANKGPAPAADKGDAFRQWQQHPLADGAPPVAHFDAGWMAAKAAPGELVGFVRLAEGAEKARGRWVFIDAYEGRNLALSWEPLYRRAADGVFPSFQPQQENARG